MYQARFFGFASALSIEPSNGPKQQAFTISSRC